MISLRIRYVRLSLILFAAMILVGLVIVANTAIKMNVGNLLLIVPKVADGRGIDTDTLADLYFADGDKPASLLLTYEIATKESVKAFNASYQVTLVKTSYTYPYVMGCNVLGGAFFTESDELQGRKAVALNQRAASAIFGGYDVTGAEIIIGGEKFTVSGVIQNDDDENSYAYVPASYYSDNPNLILVKLDASEGVSEEYVRNECKTASITDNQYDFINMASISGFVGRLPITGICFAAIGLLAFALYWLSAGFLRSIKGLRKVSAKFYMKDVILGRAKGAGASIGKFVLALPLLAVDILLLFLLLPGFIEDFLVLRDISGFLKTSYASFYSSDSSSSIGSVVYSLQKLMLSSLILLAIFGFAVIVFVVLAFQKNKFSTDSQA